MKTITLFVTLIFYTGLLGTGFAKEELKMQKVALPQVISLGDSVCDEIVKIDLGQNVPDMRREFCSGHEGKFNLTLSGPAGTTVTFFEGHQFSDKKGYLILKKSDDRSLWLLDLISFPNGKWSAYEATKDSGAFEIFYKSAPRFDERISSIKWGQWWADNSPGGIQ